MTHDTPRWLCTTPSPSDEPYVKSKPSSPMDGRKLNLWGSRGIWSIYICKEKQLNNELNNLVSRGNIWKA